MVLVNKETGNINYFMILIISVFIAQILVVFDLEKMLSLLSIQYASVSSTIILILFYIVYINKFLVNCYMKKYLKYISNYFTNFIDLSITIFTVIVKKIVIRVNLLLMYRQVSIYKRHCIFRI